MGHSHGAKGALSCLLALAGCSIQDAYVGAPSNEKDFEPAKRSANKSEVRDAASYPPRRVQVQLCK